MFNINGDKNNICGYKSNKFFVIGVPFKINLFLTSFPSSIILFVLFACIFFIFKLSSTIKKTSLNVFIKSIASKYMRFEDCKLSVPIYFTGQLKPPHLLTSSITVVMSFDNGFIVRNGAMYKTAFILLVSFTIFTATCVLPVPASINNAPTRQSRKCLFASN